MVISVTQPDVFPLPSVATAVTIDVPIFMDAVPLLRELKDVAPDDVYLMDTSLQSSVADARKSTCILWVPQFTVCNISRAHSISGCSLSTEKGIFKNIFFFAKQDIK